VRFGILLAAASATLVVGLVLQPVVLRALTAASILDVPSSRSSHRRPTPRGGGIAVVAAAATGLLVLPTTRALALPLVTFAAIGLAEDLRGEPVRARLLLQVVAGAGTVALLLPAGAAVPVAASLVAAVAVVGYVNAFNFMDGVDGISALSAIVAGGAYAAAGIWLDLPALAAGGALAAVAAATFLPWNLVHARVFLGDVGSYGLGGLIAALAVYGALRGVPVELVLAPLALYLADTGATLARRMHRREDWLRPHRTHVYQRLTDRGLSHAQVAAATAAASLALCALAALAVAGTPIGRLALDGAALAVLTGYLTSPSWVDRPARPTTLAGRPDA